MDLKELETKLFAAGRAHPPSDTVPYAFEKRVLAHITSRTIADDTLVWARALWRGAASCIAITLLLTAWTFFTPSDTSSTGDLAQDVDNTVLAAVDQEVDYSW